MKKFHKVTINTETIHTAMNEISLELLFNFRNEPNQKKQTYGDVRKSF